jgi:hypothetical protein
MGFSSPCAMAVVDLRPGWRAGSGQPDAQEPRLVRQFGDTTKPTPRCKPCGGIAWRPTRAPMADRSSCWSCCGRASRSRRAGCTTAGWMSSSVAVAGALKLWDRVGSGPRGGMVARPQRRGPAQGRRGSERRQRQRPQAQLHPRQVGLPKDGGGSTRRLGARYGRRRPCLKVGPWAAEPGFTPTPCLLPCGPRWPGGER